MAGNMYSLSHSGGGDLVKAHAAVWAAVERFVRDYSDDAGDVQDLVMYLDVACPEREGDVDERALHWSFPNPGGCCARSMNAWSHWFALAVASEWDDILALAGRHGVTITSGRPTDQLDASRFVTLRGTLWKADPDGLFGDDRSLALAELTDTERTHHMEALAACGCWVCPVLRPDPDRLSAMISDLGRGDTDGRLTATRAALLLTRCGRHEFDALAAMIDAGPTYDSFDPVHRYVERYARAVPGAWGRLITMLPDQTEPDRFDLTLHGLWACRDAAERTDAELAQFRELLRTAADPAGRCSDTADYLLEELDRAQA